MILLTSLGNFILKNVALLQKYNRYLALFPYISLQSTDVARQEAKAQYIVDDGISTRCVRTFTSRRFRTRELWVSRRVLYPENTEADR